MISEHAMYLFPVWQLSGISFVVVHHDKKWELKKKKLKEIDRWNWSGVVSKWPLNSWELLSKVGNK